MLLTNVLTNGKTIPNMKTPASWLRIIPVAFAVSGSTELRVPRMAKPTAMNTAPNTTAVGRRNGGPRRARGDNEMEQWRRRKYW